MTVDKYTERQMLDYLHKRYSFEIGNGRRYAVAEHVKDDAGFYHKRVADFISIDCWPGGQGDGIQLHGHEVKVSRSDWLHELKDPEKAEAFKRYMDRWWLVVPDLAIVKPFELPEDWGLLSLVKETIPGWGSHPTRAGFQLRVKVQAPRLSPEPLPKPMLATLMRATAKTAKRQAELPTNS
jgi:hypothetical protein